MWSPFPHNDSHPGLTLSHPGLTFECKHRPKSSDKRSARRSHLQILWPDILQFEGYSVATQQRSPVLCERERAPAIRQRVVETQEDAHAAVLEARNLQEAARMDSISAIRLSPGFGEVFGQKNRATRSGLSKNQLCEHERGVIIEGC